MSASKSSFTEFVEKKLYSMIYSVCPANLSFFFRKCLFIRRKYVKTDQGQTFWVDPISDFGQQLIGRGVYEPQMTRLLRLVLRAGDTFVDVGGNEGYFSVIADSILGGGRICCIEPQSRLQAVVHKNLKINHCGVTRVYHMALSDKEGVIDLFLAPLMIGACSTTFKRPRTFFLKEKVNSVTLGSFIERNKIERVRLLKMDVEGGEYDIIKGGADIIGRRIIDFIALEYHTVILDPEKIRYIHGVLIASGYVLTKCNGQTIYHLKGLDNEIAGLGNLQVDASI